MKSIDTKTKCLLGIQHVLAMFGATVLVPAQTGLDPAIAIFCAGLGTLLFHLVTKGMVPVFLGSSFAFISAIQLVLSQQGIGAVKTGIMAAGLVYLLLSFLVKLFGVEKVKSFFPPIVNGPIIIVIGLRLSPVALMMSGYSDGKIDWLSFFVAGVVVISMIVVTIFARSFFKLVPILLSIVVGFIAAFVVDAVAGTSFVNLQAVAAAPWFGFSESAAKTLTTLPAFNMTAIIAIAPIAVVVFMEHIGDITTNGAVVGKNFFENPGIHRTLLGDGLATLVAGLLGGPANTTYGENTGVLAVTKVYDPSVIRIAAVMAICLSLIGKFGAIIQNIPVPVMGGVSMILFGIIASIGLRTLVESRLDFSHSRNLIIPSLILVFGIGVGDIALGSNLTISGLAVAALIGVVLNKILPEAV